MTGLYTLPWILIGFISNLFFSKLFGVKRVDTIMKKIGIILLFVFIPMLVFRLFLNIDFQQAEIDFTLLSVGVMGLLYIIAYLFGIKRATKLCDTFAARSQYIKTVFVNQGRSAAFVGSAMMGIGSIKIFAAIYITLLGVFLFAIIPYILSVMHKKTHNKSNSDLHNTLPLHLRVFPWYLLIFPISAVIIHFYMGTTTIPAEHTWQHLLNFFGAITIPAALYYVGSGININDLKLKELKNLFFGREKKAVIMVRDIVVLTIIITPLIVTLVFGTLAYFEVISEQWFYVLILNAVLPVTSTNMFLVPYGINKKATALSVTWSTLFSIPLFVLLLYVVS
jgi:hypothetical protein